MKNVLIALLLIIAVAALISTAYFYGKSQGNTYNISQTTPTITPTVAVQASPTNQAMVSKGTVTGRLCYPSSFLPKGTIVAKNTVTGEQITQEYPGSQNGGSMSYTFELPLGTYHLKYDTGGFAGFYTDYSSCVGNPSSDNCTGQKTRPLLPVTIEANKTVSDINLCDFYYPPDNPPTF